MSQKTQIQIFHGQNQNPNQNVGNLINIVTNDEQEIIYNQMTQNDQQQFSQLGVTISRQSLPIRFKQQDDDTQDYSNPIPIPSTQQGQEQKNWSYRKIFKLQVYNDQQEEGYLLNLRFYISQQSGNQQWDSGQYVYIYKHNNYSQPRQGDISTFCHSTDWEGENQFKYTQENPLMLKPDVFYDKVNDQNSSDVLRKYFGTQPYLYLQVQFDSQQTQGKQSNLSQYYVYDEV